MQIQKVTFHNLKECYECSIGDKKLIITADFGPRILSLSVGNSGNLMFLDLEKKIRTKDWYLYGGSRVWICPESIDSYSPDNDPCSVSINGNTLIVTRTDPVTLLKKTITISEKKDNFSLLYTLENTASTLYSGAIWILTCLVPKGTIFFPWGSAGSSWDVKNINYWRKWINHTSDCSGKQYIQGDDLFLIRPTGEEGKVGTSGYEGFIGVTADQYTFVKRIERNPSETYPDNNCAIECYTCAQFVELETLSPNYTLLPGVPVSHEEEWVLFNRSVNPENGDEIRKMLKDLNK